MVGSLLLRGMLAGLVAGLFCFAFLKLTGEPQVDQAIAFESRMGAAKDIHNHADEPATEEVSRDTQAGIGLLTGAVVYGASFGGLFALVFAFAHGRVGRLGPRGLSALLALAAFVAVYLIPSLKYPANPPAVGEPDTIGARTALYFAMMLISVVAMTVSVVLSRRLTGRIGAWNASLLGAAAYLVVIVAATLGLPAVDEVPAAFPAVLLWKFRVAAIGAQAVLWATTGLAFGALTEWAAAAPRALSLKTARR